MPATVGYSKLLTDVELFLEEQGFAFKEIVRTWYYPSGTTAIYGKTSYQTTN